jgi:hypothetical protein
MNDSDMSQLVRAINEIKDSIWLRDYGAAKSIVDSTIEKAKDPKLLELREKAEMIRRNICELRKAAVLKKEVKDRRSWVLSELSKSLMEKEIDPVRSIAGVYLIQLLGYRDMISLLTEPQKTLDKAMEYAKEEVIISRRKGYKYSLDRLSSKWNVRAISENKLHFRDLSKIQEFADEKRAFLDKSDVPNWQVLELYGQDMHVQIVGLDRVVEISIMVPQSKDEDEKVRLLAEKILESLMS